MSAGLRYELTPPWRNSLGQEFIVDLQTNNSPIAPFLGTQEPQNLWPSLDARAPALTRIRG